jgi:hypothetical protein
MGDPMGQDASLAATGSGEDKNTSLGRMDGFSLLII